MTNAEQKSIENLNRIVSELKSENRLLVEKFTKTIEEINNKVNQKHIPISLEMDILSTVQASMHKAIQEVLVGYNSPLLKLVTDVVNNNSTELRNIIADSFDEVIKLDDFKKSIREGFAHKIARTLISNNNGLLDKVSNELKQDTVFKSKMAIAVSNVVNECLEERKGV